MEQITPGLLVHMIGNTYAGAAMIGLTATLDIAQPGERILCVSFGSGAGSDAFDILVTDKITARQGLARKRRNTSPAAQKLITQPTQGIVGSCR
jgi:hydroxymethylglutaryl-CoA synthase